jgi:hypothetical protein
MPSVVLDPVGFVPLGEHTMFSIENPIRARSDHAIQAEMALAIMV